MTKRGVRSLKTSHQQVKCLEKSHMLVLKILSSWLKKKWASTEAKTQLKNFTDVVVG